MNYRKIILFIIIISSMLLFSCNKKVEESQLVLSSQNTNATKDSQYIKVVDSLDLESLNLGSLNEPIHVYLPDRNTVMDITRNYDYRPWSEYIGSTYGIGVYIGYYSDLSLMNNLSNLAGSDGFVSLENIYTEKLLLLARQNHIKILNNILQNCEGYYSLPDYIKYAFTDSDNNILAIPRNFNVNLSGRFYKKNVLDDLSLSIPETLDDLYEVLTKVQQTTGMKGMAYYPDNILFSFKDIFSANGCFSSNNSLSTISYQEESHTYEDFMLTEEALITLKYINLLKDNDLLLVNKNAMRSNFYDTFPKLNAFSSFEMNYFQYDNNKSNQEYAFSPGITGKLTEHYIDMSPTGSCFVIPSSTNLTDQAASSFINLFYGTTEGRNDTAFGIKNTDYIIDGDIIRVKVNEETQNVFPSLISIKDILDAKEINYTLSEDYGTKVMSTFEYLRDSFGLDDSAYHYQKPLYSFFNRMDSSGIARYGHISLAEYIKTVDYTDPDEFIEIYRKEAKILGLGIMIDKANELLGYETVYKY